VELPYGRGSVLKSYTYHKQFIPDNEWFKFYIAVRGKSIQVRLNKMLLVDYTEPAPPVLATGSERGRYLDHGTFALQCHNQGSVVRFRSVRVRPLADDLPATAGAAPAVDDVFRQIITCGARNIPMVDFHVHLKTGLTLDQALAKSRRDGIEYGIAVNGGRNNVAQDDAGLAVR